MNDGGEEGRRGRARWIEREGGERTGIPVSKVERIIPHDDASPTMIFAEHIRL